MSQLHVKREAPAKRHRPRRTLTGVKEGTGKRRSNEQHLLGGASSGDASPLMTKAQGFLRRLTASAKHPPEVCCYLPCSSSGKKFWNRDLGSSLDTAQPGPSQLRLLKVLTFPSRSHLTSMCG